MTVQAVRYKFLDTETDVAVADFLSNNSSSILNSPNVDYTAMSPDVQSFISSENQIPNVVLPTIPDPTVRPTKSIFGKIKDVASYSSKDIDSMIGGLLPSNPLAQGAYKLLATNCKTNSFKNFSLGKPYDTNIDCNGKKRKGVSGGCSSPQFGNVLNKLTNGAYNATFNDLNASLKNLVNLASFGYDMNMCGVFNALSTGMGKDILSRASGYLLGSLGSSGNIMGVMDLAGASAGLHTVLENPSGISDTLTNFKMTSEIPQYTLPDFSDRLTGSMELFSPTWANSDYDDLNSVAFSDDYNSDLDDVFSSKTLSNVISADDLDSVPSDDFTFMAGGYSSKSSYIPDFSNLA